MLFLFIFTFWVSTLSEEIENHVMIIETYETYTAEEFEYWNEDIYNHVTGLECQCSECIEDNFEDYYEYEYDDEDNSEDLD